MKASQAKEFLPMVQGIANGEQWQWKGGDGDWNDIIPNDPLPMNEPHKYRKKPEPRRFFVLVNSETGNPGHAWTPEQAEQFTDKSELVEFVEVLK